MTEQVTEQVLKYKDPGSEIQTQCFSWGANLIGEFSDLYFSSKSDYILVRYDLINSFFINFGGQPPRNLKLELLILDSSIASQTRTAYCKINNEALLVVSTSIFDAYAFN